MRSNRLRHNEASFLSGHDSNDSQHSWIPISSLGHKRHFEGTEICHVLGGELRLQLRMVHERRRDWKASVRKLHGDHMHSLALFLRESVAAPSD